MSTFAIRNVVVSVWAGSSSPAVSKPKPAYAHRSASPDASMKVLARTRARPARVATIRSVTRPSRTSAAWTSAWRRGRAPALGDEALPDDLEVLGEVGHAGARAVRVRPLDDGAEFAQGRHDVVADPADDLAGRRPRRVEAVERVEDRGARPAEEREAVDQQDRGAGAGRGDRGGRARRAGPDDADVDLGDRRGRRS